MAEKPNKARDPIHCLIVIGGQPCMSGETWVDRELRMFLFKLTRSRQDFVLNKLEHSSGLLYALKIDCLDYCTIEPFAMRPHYLLGRLFASGDFPS